MNSTTIKFFPLILGNDINSYSVARAFHEEYGIKSVGFGKSDAGPNCNSKIIDYEQIKNVDQPAVMLNAIENLSLQNGDSKILIVACGDSYLYSISEIKSKLPSNVIANYIDIQLMRKLTHKGEFYKLCEQYSIDYPKTFIHTKNTDASPDLPFEFPCILKPANGVAYWEHPFTNQKKVYKLDSQAELDQTINSIYSAGYDDSLILQEFIPGDDSFMRVLTCYSNRNHEVKMVALGHVLLEEHTPKGRGNHAVIINESNPQLSEPIKKFLKDQRYVGYSNFDIKYDERDKKYKFFEVNVRQGRSNYYITGAGYNIAKALVEDNIYQRPLPDTVVDRENAMLVIPKAVALRYVRSLESKTQLKKLARQGKIVNPLFYSRDLSLRRILFVIRWHLGHFIKYHKYPV